MVHTTILSSNNWGIRVTEDSHLDHLFQTIGRRSNCPRMSPRPREGCNGKDEEEDDDADDDAGGDYFDDNDEDDTDVDKHDYHNYNYNGDYQW